MDITYDKWLVALSLLLAIGASFVALCLAARIPHISSKKLWYWLGGGAVSMGLGIWSMHFVGMLAFHLPIPVAYDLNLTLLSIVLAIIASAFSLYVVRNGIQGLWSLIFSAGLMGGGIAGMHYTGMAALKMSPPIQYTPSLFVASILIAFFASFFALKLAFSSNQDQSQRLLSEERMSASILMGGAIAGMHYTGMSAAIFSPNSFCRALPGGIASGTVSILVVLGVIVILMFILLLLLADAKLSEKDRLLLQTLKEHNEALQIRAEHLAGQMHNESEEHARKDRLLAAIVKYSGDAIVTIDLEGLLTSWNSAAERVFGYAEGEILQCSLQVLFAPEVECDFQHMMSRIHRGEINEAHTRHRHKDGRLIDVQIRCSPLYDPNYNHVGEILVIRDVSERARIEKQLQLWASVYENSGEGILITDVDNQVVSVNRSFTLMTGYELDDVLGQDPSILSSGRHPADFYQSMWEQLNREDVWRGEVWNRKKDGHVFPAWLTISTVKSDAGDAVNYIAIFSDISEQKEREAYIHHMAHHDALTGLPNRNLLRDRLAQAIIAARRHKQKVGVMFIDLDRFKIVNDTLGHEAGDQLLIDVASRLKTMVREGDTISRQGGDEFIVVLSDINQLSDLVGIAETLLEGLSGPYKVGSNAINMTPSIGISLYPDDTTALDQLISHADAAMYHAKDQGRGNFQFFTQILNEMVAERVALEHELRHAVSRGELELYFQPQFFLNPQQLSGVEALLRWNNPTLGQVSPKKFIPLAEETGLIHGIGEWVMQKTCEVARRWRHEYGFAEKVAINISVKQLQKQDYEQTVLRILDETGVNPAQLEFELTETALMDAVEKNIEILNRFRSRGVSLAIDDFGAGYSSLNYLRRLPIDQLKIDRSFIAELPDKAEEREIASAIIALGHGLNLTVLAEGVEREEQITYLRQAGCDEVQGYYYGKPMPQENFERFLAGTTVSYLTEKPA